MKKSLGQHFLSDPRILARIADALGDVRDHTVLEIGPGRGTLTRFLIERAGRVIAIEKDRELLPGLRREFPEVALAEGDALDLDWQALAGPGRWSVAGNIPYNITSPLLEKALTPPRPELIVFLVQKEVADRLVAEPGGGDYGALTVGVQVAATVERMFGVPSGAFRPAPKVESAVVRFTPREHPLLPDSDSRGFRRFVVGLFGFRRKMLRRGLRGLVDGDGQTAEMLLARAGVNPESRPQELSPADFVRLYRAVVDARSGEE